MLSSSPIIGPFSVSSEPRVTPRGIAAPDALGCNTPAGIDSMPDDVSIQALASALTSSAVGALRAPHAAMINGSLTRFDK